MLPSASMSMLSAAGSLGRPGSKKKQLELLHQLLAGISEVRSQQEGDAAGFRTDIQIHEVLWVMPQSFVRAERINSCPKQAAPMRRNNWKTPRSLMWNIWRRSFSRLVET
jgi:hypothetical protein